MISKVHHRQLAFTLLEIMIIVAIIGLLASLAVPGFIKSRKHSQGRRILNDVRQMSASIDQWAIETGQSDGAAVNTASAALYMKSAWRDNDPLGNAYVINAVGSNQIMISTSTKSALGGVGLDWGPY